MKIRKLRHTCERCGNKFWTRRRLVGHEPPMLRGYEADLSDLHDLPVRFGKK